jgi:quercetin dioxygenase-like cupin family protein
MNRTSLAVIAFLCGLAASTAGSATSPPLGSSARTWEEIEAVQGKGLGKPIFRSPTATLDELEMHVTHLPPGKEPHPPHQHVDEEIMIVKEGTVEALVAGKQRRLGPGSVIFQASNQLHGLRNVGEVPAVYHVIRWKSPGALKAAAAPAKP